MENKKTNFLKQNLLMILGIIFFLFLIIQQYNFGLVTSGQPSDINFGFQRIYEVIEQTKHGMYDPYEMHFTFGQVGRIVNGMYPTGFILWINALVVYLTNSWLMGFLFFQVTVFLIALFSMKGLLNFTNEKSNNYVLSIMSLAFAFATLNVNAFSYSFGMNYTVALFPLILNGLIRTLTFNKKIPDWRILLGLILVATNHILGAILISFSLILVSITLIIFKETKIKVVLIEGLKTFFIVFLFSLFVYIPILIININNTLQPPWKFNLIEYAIDNKVFASGTILFILFVVFYWFKKINSLNFALSIVGFIYIFMASKLFPWNYLNDSFLKIIQFPSRFEPFSFVLIFPSLTSLISIPKKKIINIILSLLIFISFAGKFYKTQEGLIKENSRDNNNIFIKTHNEDIQMMDAGKISPKLEYKDYEKSLYSNNLKDFINPKITYKALIDYLPINKKDDFQNNNYKVVKEIDEPKLVEKKDIKINYKW